MKTHVLMVQEQFVPKVLDETKLQTIRGERKRVIKVGDRLDLRTWTGKPYRSKQKKLRVVTVTKTTWIGIRVVPYKDTVHVWVSLNSESLNAVELHELALADGFESLEAFGYFFLQTHGPEFTGNLIEWSTVS